jgi:hypothetical protein
MPLLCIMLPVSYLVTVAAPSVLQVTQWDCQESKNQYRNTPSPRFLAFIRRRLTVESNISEAGCDYVHNNSLFRDTLHYVHNNSLFRDTLRYVHNNSLFQNTLHYVHYNSLFRDTLHYVHNNSLFQNTLHYVHNNILFRDTLHYRNHIQ